MDEAQANELVAERFSRMMNATTSPLGVAGDPPVTAAATAVLLVAYLAARRSDAPEGLQQVLMVLAVKGRDPLQVVAAAVGNAQPLPQPIWSKGYDPYPRWNEVFQGLVPGMIDAFGTTDACLAKAEEQQRATAEAIRGTARLAFGGESKEPGKRP